MKRLIGPLALAGLLTLATAVPAFAHGGDSGCHFGRGHQTAWFNGSAWGENNSTNAKSEPGARADQIGQRENCR